MNWFRKSAFKFGNAADAAPAPAAVDDALVVDDFMQEKGEDLFDWDELAFRRRVDELVTPDEPVEDESSVEDAVIEDQVPANDAAAPDEATESELLLTTPETLPPSAQYRPGSICPACGGAGWIIRNVFAECSSCGTPLPLAHAILGRIGNGRRVFPPELHRPHA